MKSAKDSGVPKPTTSWENPLIPNKRLRELYTAMVQLRLLEKHVGRVRRKNSPVNIHRGEEACLVSTVHSLAPGDFTSESSLGIAIKFLRGTKLSEVVSPSYSSSGSTCPELPVLENIHSRLHQAIGAALAFSTRRKNSALVVAYVHTGDLSLPQWKTLLKFTAAHAAPILFVVLPGSGRSLKSGQVSLTANVCGVPGIPVDAADPVALYRVAQESTLRIRSGGGPVLMECIPFQLSGKAPEQTDPILRMQQLLLRRGVATEAWFEDVAVRFTTRLKRVINT